MVSFKELFENIPKTLRSMILVRLGIAVISLIAFIVVWIAFEFGVSYPLLAVAVFFAVSGLGMGYNCITGNYLKIEGKCSNIELTSVRGKIKWIYITCNEDEKILRFPPKESSKKLNIGDDVIAYIPSKVLVHSEDEVFCVPEYYGIDIEKKKMLHQ